MPKNVAQLDKALSGKDYAAITKIHDDIRSFEDITLLMNWEQVRIFNGEGGIYLSMLYMRDLWAVADSMEKAGNKAEAANMRPTSVLIGLYAYELVLLDGAKCTDSSAVSHRMDQLVGENAEIWSFVPKIPEALRGNMAWMALALEANTAPTRKDDDVLCQGGLTQMLAGLVESARTGEAPKEVPNRPGTVGRTFEVAPPKDFHVGFLAPDVWRPKQADLRQSMPKRLSELMKVKEPVAPAAPKP